MLGFLSLLLKWWALFFAAILAVGVFAYIAVKATDKLKKLLRKGALVAVAVAAVIYGGTKNITNRFTADSGLAVVKAEITIPTNEVENANLVVSWTGPDESQAFNARDLASEPWHALVDDGWLFDDRVYANGTNTAYFFVTAPASNIVPRAHYHVGTDLPPVEIEGDGISIHDFRDTSTNVVMTYTVERAILGDNAGTVRVEVQEGRGSVWMEVRWDAVYGGVTNTVTIPGFWIGRDTRWRVRLEVDQ